MIFADPPDNLGLKYNGFVDKIPYSEYCEKLFRWLELATSLSEMVWFSIYHKYLIETLFHAKGCGDTRLFIWRFTFGQHNNNDCGNGYRPILRIMNQGAKLYPDAIREPSKRQTLYHDKRANPAGRVPDDVWDFPRVCGTFKEKRKWHINQHPEALIERMIKFSTVEGDLVIDMFAGTGTVNRVCKRLNRDCIGIEISPFYCEQITKELEGNENATRDTEQQVATKSQ
ncbi:MAG: site-specific DNA-methyltransferase [Patescibacteria group bacterium]